MNNNNNTLDNYGARIIDNYQGVKQFFTQAASTANWVYKRITTGTIVITPADNKKPVYIDNDLIVRKDLYVDGSIYNPSDINLKENIKPLKPEHVDNLFLLNPILFTYKDDEAKMKHFGLLAQDVEILLPELVKTSETHKSVNYLELIPIMLEKMKQQQHEIDELKKIINK